jgi:subtilisin family serine protease
VSVFDGVLLGIANRFNFELKEKDNIKNHEELFSSLGMVIIDSIMLVNKAYHGKILYGNPVNMVNKLHESGMFEYIELDYLMKAEKHQLPAPNDPYYPHFAITRMQVDHAWNLTRGENIKIAVLDDGIDITHPDLIGNLHSTGFDATGSRNDASPRSYDYHGTMVSGVATMKANNGIGGAGIAYNAKLIPVRVGYGNWIDDFYTFPWWLSSGINYAVNEGADILNLSWSVPGTTHNITSAINAAATNGRNSKGCIIFSSSGNKNSSVSYPARLSSVIAVGASNRNDQRRPSSNYGSDLSLVAPGDWNFTTDIRGSNGKCPGADNCISDENYYPAFSGTSAASPAAAAVMALILSVNPNLTRVQATAIIESTCDKVGPYSYTISGTYGLKSSETGYGRVNARSAVIAAFQSLQPITGPTLLCTSNTNYTLVGAPQNASITWSFNPSSRVVTSSGPGTTVTLRGSSCSNIGKGRLTFNIDQPGMGTWQVFKDITVNGPDYSEVEFDVYYSSGQKAPRSGSTWLLCPQTHYHIYFSNNSGCWTSNYSWTIPSGWNLNYQYQNMISIFTNASPGGNVQVRGQTCCTACGSNVSLISGYFGQYWDCGYGYMTVYPNPAGNDFVVDLDTEKAGIEEINRNLEFILTITDNMGTVKYTDKIYEFPHRVNTRNLSNGVYIIRVILEGKTYTSRVVIDN